MRKLALTVVVCTGALLVTACGSPESSVDANPAKSPAAVPAHQFFDPCSEEFTHWFSTQGITRADALEPLIDKYGSGCSFDDSASNHYSVLSRPSAPGDEMDRWVHHRLGKMGPVTTTSVADHVTEVETRDLGRAHQECRLIVHVDYGFLDIIGGPHGRLAPSYPRDCDAVLTFADMLTREVDKRWQPGG